MVNTEGVLSTKSVNLVAQVSHKLGYLECLLEYSGAEQKKLSKATCQKKLNASIGMDLNASQLTGVSLDEAYESCSRWRLSSEESIQDAHRSIYAAFSPEAGRYRSAGMGIYQYNKLVHTTAPAGQVARQLRALLAWLEQANDHPLVKAAVFLRQYEFIQPFSVGNSSIGHLWVSLILGQWHVLLRWLNFESKLKERRGEYYDCLRASIGNNDLSIMVEFVLQRLDEAFDELLDGVEKAAKDQSEQSGSLKSSDLSSVIGSVNVHFKGIKPYFTTRENILVLLQEHPEWSAARLSEILGISDRAVEKHLAKLKSRGQLKRVGSARGGYWRVVAPLNEQLGLLQGDS
ncbi:cell filamentation protein Fic [Idiomarina piscisalsi]|uniref:Cell filamentation protein Fic n=1 Tax=Idiomarina piscisalsi TaxID=1096243 RepID=A0ABM6LTE8_9GAMM|nr:Fic family protein [Idiomarina piscisalsi]ASG65880.1 cell filamentation protein Fic [Idiomarina piscisalsi]